MPLSSVNCVVLLSMYHPLRSLSFIFEVPFPFFAYLSHPARESPSISTQEIFCITTVDCLSLILFQISVLFDLHISTDYYLVRLVTH
jgi:hypothetical protein